MWGIKEKIVVTVITVNYNNETGLEKTVNSVFEQTLDSFEYIVIDGGSTDGSKKLIQDNSEHLHYWVSEKDKGIYDAMNKGIDHATGDYIIFLNSGDTFHNNDVLSKFVGLKTAEDIVYGNTIFIRPDGRHTLKEMPSKMTSRTLMMRTLNHQSTFLKKSLFDNKRYDLSYKILADWVFYAAAIHVEGASYRHIDMIISDYSMDGLSSQSENETLKKEERHRFFNEHSEDFITGFVDEYNSLFREHQNLKKGRFMKWALKLNSLIMRTKTDS